MAKNIAWSKLSPGVWFDVLAVADEHGNYPVLAHEHTEDEDHEWYMTVHKDEISFVEIAPVPESVPDVAVMVLYGEDPEMWEGKVFASEREAKSFMKNLTNAFGFVPVAVARNAMVPA